MLYLVEIGHKDKSFAHHTSFITCFVGGFTFLPRKKSISSFFLRTQRAVEMLDDMVALANSVFLLTLSRSGRHVLALLCAGLIALRCAVFAVDVRRQNMLVHLYRMPQKKGEKRGSKKKKKWEKACRQVIEKNVVQVGPLRGQGDANGVR